MLYRWDLESMKQRLKKMAGKLDHQTQPERGTSVLLTARLKTLLSEANYPYKITI
jgi:hypothetical protein